MAKSVTMHGNPLQVEFKPCNSNCRDGISEALKVTRHKKNLQKALIIDLYAVIYGLFFIGPAWAAGNDRQWKVGPTSLQGFSSMLTLSFF